MLGLFGKKKEPETLLKKEKDRYGGSGFDPTGLERAAKAAREIDASAHARLAFDVIQAREATKRLEHGTRQAAYEMRAREYEMQSVGKEGAEARQTLAAQTDHANRQAEYADQLERRRYAANLGAQRDARAAELQRHEASLARQEELRRRTLRYEAELREKTELKRAEAEATAALAPLTVAEDGSAAPGGSSTVTCAPTCATTCECPGIPLPQRHDGIADHRRPSRLTHERFTSLGPSDPRHPGATPAFRGGISCQLHRLGIAIADVATWSIRARQFWPVHHERHGDRP